MLKMFNNAIVRTPAKSVVDGITTQKLGLPDIELTLVQHKKYIEALEKCGLQVDILPADERFPDGNYVEDVAVLAEKVAIITNPGAESRRQEISNIVTTIEKYFKKIEYIRSPGFLEGGDIMKVGSHFYIGLSTRTNEDGANQLISILKKHGYTGSTVKVSGVLHLKTGMSYMEDGTLLVTGDFLHNKDFLDRFERIIYVSQKEDYAVNCIRLNEFVLMPEGFTETKTKLMEAGYKIVETPMSEFQKMDGGLTCLSLRF
ncbi:MAG: N-dimethylarginine dimethylaminohydrolase [Clostridiales bacterium 38_11]|nr:MAG: N-dimethylarginine dimethylaminohydrolase [Clostridiales bacterium 38_11]